MMSAGSSVRYSFDCMSGDDGVSRSVYTGDFSLSVREAKLIC